MTAKKDPRQLCRQRLGSITERTDPPEMLAAGLISSLFRTKKSTDHPMIERLQHLICGQEQNDKSSSPALTFGFDDEDEHEQALKRLRSWLHSACAINAKNSHFWPLVPELLPSWSMKNGGVFLFEILSSRKREKAKLLKAVKDFYHTPDPIDKILYAVEPRSDSILTGAGPNTKSSSYKQLTERYSEESAPRDLAEDLVAYFCTDPARVDRRAFLQGLSMLLNLWIWVYLREAFQEQTGTKAIPVYCPGGHMGVREAAQQSINVTMAQARAWAVDAYKKEGYANPETKAAQDFRLSRGLYKAWKCLRDAAYGAGLMERARSPWQYYNLDPILASVLAQVTAARSQTELTFEDLLTELQERYGILVCPLTGKSGAADLFSSLPSSVWGTNRGALERMLIASGHLRRYSDATSLIVHPTLKEGR
jgi:hypothetical protein